MKTREIIETERLILRPFKLSDAKIVQKKAGQPEVADTTRNIPHPYPDGVAEEWISNHQALFEANERITYAITVKGNDEIIGAVGLGIEKKENHAELGYWIEKDQWSKGYATEASRALVGYGFSKLKLHKIFATHLTRNPASGKVMEKLGMHDEGLFKEHIIKNGKYEDLAMKGILKAEWESKYII